MIRRKSDIETLKRCPKCKMGGIYKRVRYDPRKYTKIYRCMKCGYEFDSPFIGPKELKIRE